MSFTEKLYVIEGHLSHSQWKEIGKKRDFAFRRQLINKIKLNVQLSHFHFIYQFMTEEIFEALGALILSFRFAWPTWSQKQTSEPSTELQQK